MKEIELTQGKVALIDDGDFEWLSRWKWRYHNKGYATRSSYINRYKTIEVLMHREIMNTPKGMETDHKDFNKLNNQRSNLRVCDRYQNMRNRKPNRGNSYYKGVSFSKRDNIWRAVIFYDGKQVFVGHFKNEEEAARAYDRKAKELFGEFAYLNFKEKKGK